MKPAKSRLYIAISAAILLMGSASLSAYADDAVPDPVESEIPESTETPDIPEGSEALEGSETPETPDVTEVEDVDMELPRPTPEGIAYDNEGNEYPSGGPTGLYNAIIDKQSKTAVYHEDGSVTYDGGTKGQQIALQHLRTNLERKLDKDGIEYGALDEAEIQPVVEAAAADGVEGEIPEGGIPEQEGELEGTVVILPELTDEDLRELSRVAHDDEGNTYEEGGPKGLYKAIEDKQDKLGDKVVQETDGTLSVEEGTSGNGGLKKALVKLRTNLERKLRKAGLFDDSEIPEIQPIDDVTTQTAALDSRTRGKSGEQEKIRTSSKPQKQERVASTDKSGRIDRADLFETGVTRGKPARIEKPQKPVKVQRVEKPQKPVKVTRVEKPQRVERVSRPEKFAKPEKPHKPEKPNKPGRPN